MKPRFFHILFFDSDNDKFVTNVEVRPSTHRRQEQPRAAFEVRQLPAHRILPLHASYFACSSLHASHTEPIHPWTRPAPPRITFTASLLRRTRTSILRRRGCGVHHAPPSSPRCPTPLCPQVVILDFLETFSLSSRRWSHQFLVCEPFLRSDFQRAVCVVGGTGEGVACRRGRRAHFCVVGDVSLVNL